MSVVEIIMTFLWQFGMGVVLGYGFGRIYVLVHNALRLENKSLYQILIIGFIFLTFSISNLVGATGSRRQRWIPSMNI